MSEKPWLDAYPPGVPADIDPDEHPSLAAFLEDRFERYASLPAFTNRNATFMTWNLLHLARLLKDNGGVPAHGNQRAGWDAGCRYDFENPEHR